LIRLDDILDKVRTSHPDADLDAVKKAYVFAARAHEGQTRLSGDPYVVHPLGVASIIADMRLDVASVCAGLLHDCVEDTSVSVDQLRGVFGSEVAFLVDGVTKIGKIPWNSREERQAETFRKMLMAMAKDIRVILVKLADRTDNMRTLSHMPRDKQERIARETLEIYAPLANRLGIQWIKLELEDRSFEHLLPDEFRRLVGEVAVRDKERRDYIERTVKVFEELLRGQQIGAEVSGRVKHYYGIWAKMRRTGRDLAQLTDVVAFRVITASVRDCYAALGILHSKFTPIPGRFKDYVALPKPNRYQSLHTSVLGPDKERIEIQIRTEEMHRVAEEGVAAHWRYKEGTPLPAAQAAKFDWLRQLAEWPQEVRDPAEFMESVKIDLFQDEVYVFTPRGDVKAFPKGSTPVDFAYAVHSQVGDHCSGARVNGAMVPLRYQLRNGDTVEILTSPAQRPNKDWLKFVASSRAKTKIRQVLRQEERERAKELGGELLERELRRYGASFAKLGKAGRIAEAAERLHTGSEDELLVTLGYGKLMAADVVAVLLPEEERSQAQKAPGPLEKILRKVTGAPSTGIQVQGLDDVLIRFAKCCSPVPGDPILGFVTHGRGVAVHTRDCSKALDLDPVRRVDVEWDRASRAPRPVSVQVVCADKPGLLANISRSFSEVGVNISQAHCRATDDERAVNTFQFTVHDVDELRNVIRALQKIPGVYSVQRV
jgi:GTP diphosphokinase / guanosine-3',5'-bis(diphosphate) 3'-diphosphatase